MAHKHSRVLFTHGEGRPMRFQMPPCADKARLKDLIEYGGGILSSKFDKNSIRIAVPGKKIHESGALDMKYITDCVEQNNLLKMNEYKLCSGDVVQVSDSDLSPASNIVTVKDLAKSHKGRKRFLLSEDIRIIKYLVDEGKYDDVKGNTIWKQMGLLKILPGHTWMSIRDRYLKKILPNIQGYNVSDLYKAKLDNTIAVAPTNVSPKKKVDDSWLGAKDRQNTGSNNSNAQRLRGHCKQKNLPLKEAIVKRPESLLGQESGRVRRVCASKSYTSLIGSTEVGMEQNPGPSKRMEVDIEQDPGQSEGKKDRDVTIDSGVTNPSYITRSSVSKNNNNVTKNNSLTKTSGVTRSNATKNNSVTKDSSVTKASGVTRSNATKNNSVTKDSSVTKANGVTRSSDTKNNSVTKDGSVARTSDTENNIAAKDNKISRKNSVTKDNAKKASDVAQQNSKLSVRSESPSSFYSPSDSPMSSGLSDTLDDFDRELLECATPKKKKQKLLESDRSPKASDLGEVTQRPVARPKRGGLKSVSCSQVREVTSTSELMKSPDTAVGHSTSIQDIFEHNTTNETSERQQSIPGKFKNSTRTLQEHRRPNLNNNQESAAEGDEVSDSASEDVESSDSQSGISYRTRSKRQLYTALTRNLPQGKHSSKVRPKKKKARLATSTSSSSEGEEVRGRRNASTGSEEIAPQGSTNKPSKGRPRSKFTTPRGNNSLKAQSPQDLRRFMMADTQFTQDDDDSRSDADNVPVALDLRELTRAKKAIKDVSESSKIISQAELLQVCHWVGGDLNDAFYYLREGRTKSGRPVWKQRDDLMLQDGNDPQFQQLEQKFGHTAILKRQKYLELE